MIVMYNVSDGQSESEYSIVIAYHTMFRGNARTVATHVVTAAKEETVRQRLGAVPLKHLTFRRNEIEQFSGLEHTTEPYM